MLIGQLRDEYLGEVDVGRSESGARRREKSEEERMDSGNAKVEGDVGEVHLYNLSMPGVYSLGVSRVAVYCTSKERQVGCASRTTSHTEVDIDIVGKMN